MEIKEVPFSFLNDVFKTYRGCAKYHAEKGFFQWDKNYPTLQIVENDINNGQLFGVFENKTCLGCIALTHDEPEQYAQLEWEDSNGKHLIIHRLCIDTNHMRKGLAKKLMDYSESWAKDKKYSSIRLDTYSLNKGAVQFYSDLGYQYRGAVFFEKRKDNSYTCFEKIL